MKFISSASHNISLLAFHLMMAGKQYRKGKNYVAFEMDPEVFTIIDNLDISRDTICSVHDETPLSDALAELEAWHLSKITRRQLKHIDLLLTRDGN